MGSQQWRRGYDTLADVMTVSVDGTGNVRPVANAGPDQFAPAADGKYASVTLSGTGSTDPEGSALDYIWTTESMKVSGSETDNYDSRRDASHRAHSY